MKTKCHYPKLLTCTFLILPVISILSLQAQDILISFAGSGESTTVDSVKVENLTQGTILKMKGSYILHLMAVITGIEAVGDNGTGKIGFYPNPMKDNARMQFDLPVPGEIVITMYDLSGRKIAQTRDLLSKGQHTYAIQGVEEGVYFVTIRSGGYSLSGKLISSGSKNGSAKIAHESSAISQEKQSDSKGTNAEAVMQYNVGDRLKLKGISGIYSTVVIDVPTGSKIITFNFNDCTDGDGNHYSIVCIGTVKGATDNPDHSDKKGVQIWMAENLKTTKYNDFTTIPNVSDLSEWLKLTSPAFCWYNNEIGYKNVYGALYNWYAASNAKLCPLGWRVPTDVEWTTLTNFLGGENMAGGKLKETGYTHWYSPNVGATNETGFTALPGGYKDASGGWGGIRYFGHLWSSSDNLNGKAWQRYMDLGNTIVWRYAYDYQYGFSVRCIKD